MKAPAQIATAGGYGEIVRFAQQAIACLARGITLGDNCRGDVKRLEGVVDTSFPADVACSLPSTPIEVRVLSMTPRGGDGARTSGNLVTWSWVPSADGRGVVRITTISSMTSGVAYDVALWIGGG